MDRVPDRQSENEQSDVEDGLQLPRKNIILLRVPFVLLLLEKTGLCRCCGSVKIRRRTYQTLVVILTFLCYMGYHMTRKTISAIKSNLHPHCNETDTGFFNSSFVPSIPISNITPRVVGASGQFEWSNATLPDFVVCPAGWPPFDTKVEGEAELGALDYCFLFAYAVAMFVSGFIADRTPLRYYLTIGMMGVVITTVAFGVGFFTNIHSIAYYIVVQILGGIAQSTGWPGVVAVMANWFGKGNRGFIMGLWNTHTSIGNILGTIIPGAVQQHGWGWAFVSTAGIMFVITVMIFFLLPSEPAVVGLKQPNTDQQSSKVQAVVRAYTCVRTYCME